MLILLVLCISVYSQELVYPWLTDNDSASSLVNRINPPDDFTRISTESGSFSEWLQNLPLKPGNPPIYYHDGRKKFMQLANFAVIDIDIGEKDLQQCADAVLRLRCEYFYSKKDYDLIAFNFTSGDKFCYSEWLEGKTPVIKGNVVRWIQKGKRTDNRGIFKKYLEILFTYAGSYSLSKELNTVDDITDMRIGDVFIEGGFPGHAMIVIDMAENRETGGKVFLLAQSYMPAQSIHIVKRPLLGAWFNLDFEGKLRTLEWAFDKDDLMRFK